MSVLNGKIDMLKHLMCEDASIYTDYKRIAETEAEIADLQALLAPLEEEWLALSEQV